jgi:hypothetical protein
MTTPAATASPTPTPKAKPTPTPRPLPDLTGQTVFGAEVDLADLGFTAYSYRDITGQNREMTDAAKRDWEVCGQEPSMGAPVTPDDKVVLIVAKAGENCGKPSRDNSAAAQVTLGAGEFSVMGTGGNVTPGRYVITPGAGESGNLFVRDSSGDSFVNEILGGNHGVPSVTVDLDESDTIEIRSMTTVTFTPVETTVSTTLTTGYWIVGLDIPAGRYTATPAEGQSGNFFVRGTDGYSTVNEILGGSHGVPNITVNLTDGQEIEIRGISSVSFT